MKTIKEIIYNSEINLTGNSIRRNAVRAIIHRDEKLLLIYSRINGDYKFPGGGVERGETRETALQREVREECGLSQIQISKGVGKIVEYRKSIEEEYDFFMMVSHYYICQIGPNNQTLALALDKYEAELEFNPVWVDIGNAIQTNKNVLLRDPTLIPRWTERDTFMLNYILNTIIKTN